VNRRAIVWLSGNLYGVKWVAGALCGFSGIYTDFGNDEYVFNACLSSAAQPNAASVERGFVNPTANPSTEYRINPITLLDSSGLR
jgi:hypothetical protein